MVRKEEKLTVVVFGEAGLEALELVAGGRLSPLHVGVALKATNWKRKRARDGLLLEAKSTN